jgi:hypothetical protein
MGAITNDVDTTLALFSAGPLPGIITHDRRAVSHCGVRFKAARLRIVG